MYKMAMRHYYGDVKLVMECMSIYKSKLVHQLAITV